jgi:hypothetical protein
MHYDGNEENNQKGFIGKMHYLETDVSFNSPQKESNIHTEQQGILLPIERGSP